MLVNKYVDGNTIENLYDSSNIIASKYDLVSKKLAIIFKNGFNHNKIKFLGNSWENSNLRNLHFCFLKRSSREKEKIVARNAPFEIGKNRYLKSQILYFAYLMISLIKGNMKLKSLFYLLKHILVSKCKYLRK